MDPPGNNCLDILRPRLSGRFVQSRVQPRIPSYVDAEDTENTKTPSEHHTTTSVHLSPKPKPTPRPMINRTLATEDENSFKPSATTDRVEIKLEAPPSGDWGSYLFRKGTAKTQYCPCVEEIYSSHLLRGRLLVGDWILKFNGISVERTKLSSFIRLASQPSNASTRSIVVLRDRAKISVSDSIGVDEKARGNADSDVLTVEIPPRKTWGVYLKEPTSSTNNHPSVSKVYDASCPVKGNLMAGDWILECNGLSTRGMSVTKLRCLAFQPSPGMFHSLLVLRKKTSRSNKVNTSLLPPPKEKHRPARKKKCEQDPIVLTKLSSGTQQPRQPDSVDLSASRVSMTLRITKRGPLGIIIEHTNTKLKAGKSFPKITRVERQSPLYGKAIVGDWISHMNGIRLEGKTAAEICALSDGFSRSSSSKRKLTVLRDTANMHVDGNV